MAEAVRVDDRLPWLDSPRPAAPKVTRRARRPLFVLLGLFFAGAIAVMAYLAGRTTSPVAVPPAQERNAQLPAPLPAPALILPTPSAPALAPAPVASSPAPASAAPVEVATADPRSARSTARPKAATRRSATPEPKPAPLAVAPPVVASTRAPPAAGTVPPRRIVWAAQPFAGPRGRVIELGAHLTQGKADAAWWRLARDYPYLTTLPRMVIWYGPSPGRPRYYRVRLAAGSRREAQALCRNVVRLGRACTIV